MAAIFDPFQDRLSRDIRNGLSSAFIKSIAALDPEPFRQEATRYLTQATGVIYRAYITERLQNYEAALASLKEDPAEPLRQAVILWDLGLFFEVHELLEPAWRKAEGEEKLILQAMIRAAGVYIKLEYGYREAALGMAGKALPVLAACREYLEPFLPPALLLRALENPKLPAPKLLT